jgi:hypothetical protein
MSDSYLPESVKDVFDNGNQQYQYFEDRTENTGGMDNIESMQWFLDHIEAPEENIEIDDGTQVVLKHPDYDYEVVIDSGGLGDFYSHSFDTTRWNPETDSEYDEDSSSPEKS